MKVFKYCWFLFMSKGRMEHEFHRQVGPSGTVLDRRGADGAAPEDEPLDVPSSLCSRPHLCSLGQNETMLTCTQMISFPMVVGLRVS